MLVLQTAFRYEFQAWLWNQKECWKPDAVPTLALQLQR